MWWNLFIVTNWIVDNLNYKFMSVTRCTVILSLESTQIVQTTAKAWWRHLANIQITGKIESIVLCTNVYPFPKFPEYSLRSFKIICWHTCTHTHTQTRTISLPRGSNNRRNGIWSLSPVMRQTWLSTTRDWAVRVSWQLILPQGIQSDPMSDKQWRRYGGGVVCHCGALSPPISGWVVFQLLTFAATYSCSE